MALIPLGILSASAGSSVEPAPAMELIATAFGTGASGTITFSSIPQDYKHLQVRYVAKNTGNSRVQNITMNGVTSAVYAKHTLAGFSTNLNSGSDVSSTAIIFASSITTSTTTNAVGAGIIDILDYASTTKNKTVRTLNGMSDSESYINLSSGLYAQTTAISSITFTTAANNFSALTRYSIYGIKG